MKRRKQRIGICSVLLFFLIWSAVAPWAVMASDHGDSGSSDSSSSTSTAGGGTVDDSGVKSIESLGSSFQELSEGTLTGHDLEKSVYNDLGYVILAMRNVRSAAQSERVFQALGSILTQVDGLLQRMENTDSVIKRLGDITDLARGMVTGIEDKEKNASLTAGYLEKIAPIIRRVDTGTRSATVLKNRVFGLAEESAKKIGEFTFEKRDSVIAGDQVTVTYRNSDLASKISGVKTTFSTLDSALSKAIGTDGARKLQLAAVFRSQRPAGVQTIEGKLDKEVINTLKTNGIGSVGIWLGDASLQLDTDLLRDHRDELILTAVYSEGPVSGLPAGASPLAGGFSVDVALTTGAADSLVLDRPSVLTFDLSSLDLTAMTSADLKKLVFYRFDAESSQWMPVGGTYDSVTKRVAVNRGHLSKYTVLKTERSFSDVQNSWAKDDINELLGKGIITSGDSSFNPGGSLTREEFAQWIANAYGLDAKGVTMPFSDVPTSHPYYSKLAAVYSQGLMNGRTDKRFDPKGTITRQEMATLIASALKKYNSATADARQVAKLNGFQDNSVIASWSRDNVALVNELGLMQGDQRGFRPTDTITREEAAKVLKQLYSPGRMPSAS